MLCNMIWKLNVLETDVYVIYHFWVSTECTIFTDGIYLWPIFKVVNTDITSII
jgi:hypothetical protein